MSLLEQLKILFEKKILPVDRTEFTSNDHCIIDFKDGSLYKNFTRAFGSTRLNKVYSLGMNTDGISLCSKSNLSIWPIYLTINELNKKWRFSQECVIQIF